MRSMKCLESHLAHSRCSIKVSRPPSLLPHPVLGMWGGPEPGASSSSGCGVGKQQRVTLPYCVRSSPFGPPGPSGSSRGSPVWASEAALSFSGTNFMNLSFRANEDKSVPLFMGRMVATESLSHSFIHSTNTVSTN